MEISRYWRLNSRRLRFTGWTRERDGVKEISLNGMAWRPLEDSGERNLAQQNETVMGEGAGELAFHDEIETHQGIVYEARLEQVPA